jgi:predicted Zn-dependent peptidase
MRRQHWRKVWETVRSEAEYIDVVDKDGKTVVLITLSPIPHYADSAFAHAIQMAQEAGGGEITIKSLGRIVLARFQIEGKGIISQIEGRGIIRGEEALGKQVQRQREVKSVDEQLAILKRGVAEIITEEELRRKLERSLGIDS